MLLVSFFFDTYGISDHSLSKKFSSDVAGAYRAKIIALVESRPWTDPKPEELPKYRQTNSALSVSVPTKPATPSRSDNTNTRTPMRGSPSTAVSNNPPNSPNSPNTPVNPVYQRYGHATSLSSSDYFGSGGGGGGGGSGYNGSSYNGSGYNGSGYQRGKGFDIDKIANVIQEEGQKGLSMAVKYFNKARFLTGNGYDNLDKGSSLMSYSGGSQYTSGDRFYRINDYQPRAYPPPNQPQQPQSPSSPKTNPQRQQPPSNNNNKPLTSPKAPPPPSAVVPSVDEGGWDLSDWNDEGGWDLSNWDDIVPVFTTTNSDTTTTDNTLSLIDIWDFGTRPVGPTPTTPVVQSSLIATSVEESPPQEILPPPDLTPPTSLTQEVV
jgi:hypothetical protein